MTRNHISALRACVDSAFLAGFLKSSPLALHKRYPLSSFEDVYKPPPRHLEDPG